MSLNAWLSSMATVDTIQTRRYEKVVNSKLGKTAM